MLMIVLWFVNGISVMALGEREDAAQYDNAALFRNIGMMYLGAQEIPDFTVHTLDNQTVTLSSFKGKIVFLNFWATWCPPCQAEMPSMERLYKQFEGLDIAFLAVSVGETAETVHGFLAKTPYSFPIALNPDGRLGTLYAARGIPSTYILDREGRIAAARIGAQEWDTQKIIEAFNQFMKQEL